MFVLIKISYLGWMGGGELWRQRGGKARRWEKEGGMKKRREEKSRREGKRKGKEMKVLNWI